MFNHSQTAHSCEVCDLPSVVSAAQTNNVSQGVIHHHDNATPKSTCLTGILWELPNHPPYFWGPMRQQCRVNRAAELEGILCGVRVGKKY
jgi:hypothetical protein